MANIIDDLTARIEKRLTETKNPCKSYATKEAAEKALNKLAHVLGAYYNDKQSENARPARYVVFYVEGLKKWTGAIDLQELISRKSFGGGYMGIATDAGFYTY